MLSERKAYFKVATLNCWALPQPWPFGSLHRRYRIEKITETILKSSYDVVTLQEIWSEKDFLYIAHTLSEKFPHSHYFHSGFTGSGTCVISAHPITSTLLHRYSLNGFPHHVHRGDWFGGKIVGMVELKVKSVVQERDLRVLIYTTHLHAEYNRKNDLYLPHRISQCFELTQFLHHTSQGADFIVLSGDFNIEPKDLGYQVITNMAQLTDAWDLRPVIDNESGMTCDRPDNCFTSRNILKEQKEGKRLDYIMFQTGRIGLELIECNLCFDKIAEPIPMNYSDHCGLSATFLLKRDPPYESNSARLRHIATEKMYLEQSLRILEEGEVRVLWDRRLFLALCFILGVFIIATVNIESSFPWSTVWIAILRFVFTLFIGFSLWHGFIGLTIEIKALKETKYSVRKILKNAFT